MSDWNRYGSESGISGYDYESDQDSQGSSGMRERAGQSVEKVRASTKEATERARSGFDHYFHQHPLLMGLGALALGVTIGLLLPSTRQEERWMGESASKVRDRTRETASKAADVAKSTFEEARDTAREELEGSGLDPQHLKESAKETASKVRETAEKTAEEARRTAEEEADRKNLR